MVSYLPYYTTEEHHRHDVRPGLTGLAQVNGRNNITWEQKFEYDLEYIDDGITLIGDVKIIVYKKPRDRCLDEFSLSDEEGKRTPFAI